MTHSSCLSHQRFFFCSPRCRTSRNVPNQVSFFEHIEVMEWGPHPKRWDREKMVWKLWKSRGPTCPYALRGPICVINGDSPIYPIYNNGPKNNCRQVWGEPLRTIKDAPVRCAWLFDYFVSVFLLLVWTLKHFFLGEVCLCLGYRTGKWRICRPISFWYHWNLRVPSQCHPLPPGNSGLIAGLWTTIVSYISLYCLIRALFLWEVALGYP